jgi:UDP:flavonoid glycosyltransferase YjiC (YdhE family)
MNILIPVFSPSTGTWGSLTRVLAVGRAAASRGHQVAYCAGRELADRLQRTGNRVFVMPASTMLGLPRPVSRLLESRSQEMALPVKPGRGIGSIWLVLLFSGMTGRRYLQRLVEAELAAVSEFMPDLLFTEMDPGAILASRITGVPLAATYASVMRVGVGSVPWRKLHASMELILRRHGRRGQGAVDFFEDESVLKIVPSIPELEEGVPATQRFAFVGSLLRSFTTPQDAAFTLEPGKRCVFAYVGTGSVTQETLRRVLPLVFPEGGDTVCLVGAQSVRQELRLGNVIFRPYFDAEAIIPRCDWVICHAGHNTIMQSLGFGVPLILFPGPIFERRFNARMVERAGAGVFGELPDFNPGWLSAAMVGRAVPAAAAADCAGRIRAHGGADAAVQAMERFVAGSGNPGAADVLVRGR